MKTIREIANELGVDKQKVYRFIKQNHINEAHHEALQRSGVNYYDEAAETLIKQGFRTKPHQVKHIMKHIMKHIKTASMKRFLMRLLRCYKRNLR